MLVLVQPPLPAQPQPEAQIGQGVLLGALHKGIGTERLGPATRQLEAAPLAVAEQAQHLVLAHKPGGIDVERAFIPGLAVFLPFGVPVALIQE